MMEYKGYVATVELDDSIDVFHGRVVNCGPYPVATFEAADARDLRGEFERSINEYLAWCEEDGVAPKQPTADNALASTTTDAAAANDMTVDSFMLRALLLALGHEEGDGINKPDWRLERIRVNDTGLLHPKKCNSWLDPTQPWEVAFFLPQQPCIMRIEFEQTSDLKALKPARINGQKKANHKNWKVLSQDANNDSPRNYLGLVRPSPRQNP